MNHESWWVCSDLHWLAPGDPANDATPGARDEIDRQRARHAGRLLALGDMSNLWERPRLHFGLWVWTDVRGNHDEDTGRPLELRIGDTLFCHGHHFLDPRRQRWVGRPLCRVLGRLERRWPRLDDWLGWLWHWLRGGRHINRRRAIRKAVKYAKRRGVRQLVFGHLHELIDTWVDGIHVVCCGCCCGGRMDFVRVVVCHDDKSQVSGLKSQGCVCDGERESG